MCGPFSAQSVSFPDTTPVHSNAQGWLLERTQIWNSFFSKCLRTRETGQCKSDCRVLLKAKACEALPPSQLTCQTRGRGCFPRVP